MTIDLDAEIKLSCHSMQRMKERLGKMSNKDKYALARKALCEGKSPIQFYETDNKVFDYLLKKQRSSGTTIRVLEGVVYIYSNDKPCTLLTCYELPKDL